MELWISTKQEENDPAEKTVIPNSWRVSIDSTNSLFPNKFISRRNDPIQRNIMGHRRGPYRRSARQSQFPIGQLDAANHYDQHRIGLIVTRAPGVEELEAAVYPSFFFPYFTIVSLSVSESVTLCIKGDSGNDDHVGSVLRMKNHASCILKWRDRDPPLVQRHLIHRGR